MSDPLQGYFEKTTPAPSTGDPLAGYFGGPTEDERDLSTAMGRERERVSNLQSNIDKLLAIKPANAEHKARIEKLIASYQRQLPHGYGFIPGTTDESGDAKNALAGFFAGIPQGLMGGAALAGALVAPAGKGPFKGLSERVAEANQQINEDVNPQGGVGAVGQLVGQLAGGTLPYGTAASVATEQIGKAIPSVGRMAEAAAAPGSRAVQRIGANLVGGVPINLVLAVGQPVSGDASHDLAARAKQFGIGTVADVLFGMLPAHARKTEAPSKVTADPNAPAATLAPERTQAFIETQAKRQAREAVAAYDKQAKTQARAQWQVANQGKKWTDLIPEDRKTLVKQWKEANPPKPVEPVVTPEQQAAIQAGAQPVESPVEVAATNGTVQKALEGRGMSDTYNASDLMKALHAADEAADAGLTFDQFIEKHPGMKTFVDPTWYDARTTKRAETQRAANVDDLTGLGNKRAYKQALPTAEADPGTSLVRFDMNGFKSVNDVHGHAKGDEVLQQAADRLRQAASEVGVDPRIFRPSGDEFTAIIPADKAEAFRARVEELFGVQDIGKDVKVSVSGGVGSTDAMADAAAMAQKIVQKGQQGIRGRAEVPAPEAPSGVREGTPSGVANETTALGPEDDFDKIVADVQARGGLKQPDELAAFNQELINLHERALSPEEFNAEIEQLKDDFSPLAEGDLGRDVQGSAGQGIAPANPESGQGAAVPGNRPGATAATEAGPAGTIAAHTTPEVALPTLARVSPEEPSPPQRAQNHTTTTRLETIDSKPLEELSPRKIETITDRLLHQLDSADPGTPEYEAMHRDLEKLMAAEKAAEPSTPLVSQAEAPLPPEAVLRPAITDSNITGAAQVTRIVEEAPPALDPKIARKLFGAQLKRMSPEDLDAHIDDMQSRVSVLGKDEGQPYRERLDKALEERAERFQSRAGVRLQIPPAAGGFTAGFIGGFLSSDDDTDRLTNGLMWGLVGAGAGLAAGRLITPRLSKPISADAPLPGGMWEDAIDEHVVSDYVRGKPPVNFREKMRNMYAGIIRRTYVAERFVQSLGAGRLGAEKNPAKLLAMYGRWQGQVESALKYGPAIFDEFGNYKKLDALGIDQILGMVDGDVRSLGNLMVARTKVEMGDAIKTPFDTVAAEKMFWSVGEKYHQAADEMRKFSLALAEVLVDSGNLSKDALSKFKTETMYAAMQRVFKFDRATTVAAEAGSSAVVKASQPLKLRKGGGDTDIKNPVESTIASMPYIYRAAEQNKIKSAFVDAWEAVGSPTWLMKRISKSEVKETAEHEAQVAALTAEIKGLTPENANALVVGMNPNSINPLEGTMRLSRAGVVESYRIPKELALAMQTMNPEDLGMLTKIIGAPARLASKGITYNPFFLGKMALFDAWQDTLNSQYGFRFGIDNMRGWLNIVTRSKAYQEGLGVGLSHQSFAGSKESFSTTLQSVKTNVGSPLEIAVKQLRQMRPVEAYKTLVTPLADAGRVGEYLRALDHGASTIEAVSAAKQVSANYAEIGQFAQMRALNHIIMFLNPALQVMDQAFYRMGVHPFRVGEEGRMSDMVRYGTKAFASITLPSLLLWAKYHDDDEITQLRQTRNGRHYWFLRSPVTVPGVVDRNEIIKIPKPLFDGQVWGTSMEAALDNMKGKDPQAAGAVAQSLLRDAAFNILPTVAEIPYSLQANQDLSFGGPIIPLADDQLALEHQGESNASWISREISQGIAPLVQGSESQMLRNSVTPAGLDFIIRNVGGTLGQDALTAISQAMESQTKGYVPAKEELPLIKNVVVDYPSTRTRNIEMFYDRLRSVQTVGATIDHLAKEDPEKLIGYMENNQADYMLVASFGQARQTIANFRRAIGDIKKMDASAISSEDRRQIIKTYIEMMQQAAATAMLQAREIDSALKQ